jgi:isoleucyl-tRNA synthetase
MDPQNVDLKRTVNLPKTAFSMKANLPQTEPKMLERWEKEDLYQRIRASRAGRPTFILHDGPPYANGRIHLGTAFNKILKDFIVKSKTMAGFDSPYVPGWDCHGLPIEIRWIATWARARPKCRPWKSAPPAANTRRSTSTCSGRISSAWEFWASGTIPT